MSSVSDAIQTDEILRKLNDYGAVLHRNMEALVKLFVLRLFPGYKSSIGDIQSLRDFGICLDWDIYPYCVPDGTMF